MFSIWLAKDGEGQVDEGMGELHKKWGKGALWEEEDEPLHSLP